MASKNFRILFYVIVSVAIATAAVLGYTTHKYHSDASNYKAAQKQLNQELEYKDFQLDSLQGIQDSIRLDRIVREAKIKDFEVKVADKDSIRKIIKEEGREKHNIIDRSNASELADILSRLVE